MRRNVQGYSQEPISPDDLFDMFDGEIPMEVVSLIFDSPKGWTIGRIRAETRRIADQAGATIQ